MAYRKILVSLPEETIKSLDLYRFCKGISRTQNIRNLVTKRLDENKNTIEHEKAKLLSPKPQSDVK